MRILAAVPFAVCLAAAAPEPPKLRLGDGARPLRYSIDLTLAPNQDAFQGTADENIEIRRPTFVLWLNATNLQIRQASFRGTAGAVKPQVIAGGSNFIGFVFEKPVMGKGILHIVYEGKISRNSSAGIFQLKDGAQWYVYTQFEPTDARRAFPCFDEPNFKTPWQLTLHVPKDDAAFSNTPELEETAEANNMKAVRFKETRPLSSYLVAFAVGRFDVAEAGSVGRTPLRVITPKGRAAEAAYAAAILPPLLTLLERYFGVPFPYEKLDSIAMPISNFAMENAGLITYSSGLLLTRPQSDSLDRQRTFAFTAIHEMAHQWFGDLVTTSWWNDIWLNEAFATWMERKIAGEWRPDWRVDVTEVKERLHAMDLDSLATARRIRQPIKSDSDIANAFDDITYEKGAAVVRMFEAWIGPEKFRAGVQRYLRRHAWGNATAADFEAALSAAAGRNIAPAFDSFLDQAGVPELSVTLDCSGPRAKLNIAQKRSLPIGSEGATDSRWLIPVCLKATAGAEAQKQCLVLADPATELSLQAPGCPDLLDLNDSAAGYYRVAYPGALLERALADGGRRLTAAARASALGDAGALAGTGSLSPRVALSLASGFANSTEPQVVEIATQIAEMVKEDAVPPELRSNASRFIRQTYGARAAALGWLPKAAESEDTRLVRNVLVPFVAQFGEQRELIEEARQLANRWFEDRKAIGPDMLEPVLVTAAAFGDRALFDRLHAAALREQDPRVGHTLLTALGSFRDPQIERAALALLLTREFDMRQALFPLMSEPLKNPETRDLPFQFVKEHLDALLANIPREVGGDFAASLSLTGRAFCDEEHRSEVRLFFEGRVKDYVGGERNLAQALESIGLCIARRNALAPGLAQFLQSH